VIEFKVADDLLGLIIGKGGARIKKITEEFEVKQIKVADGKVVIVGKDHRSAEAARAQLEIFEELVELDDDAFDGIESDVRSLQDIKNSSDVLVASLLRADRAVKLIGTASSMYSAKVPACLAIAITLSTAVAIMRNTNTHEQLSTSHLRPLDTQLLQL
jgi:hypothetical protein